MNRLRTIIIITKDTNVHTCHSGNSKLSCVGSVAHDVGTETMPNEMNLGTSDLVPLAQCIQELPDYITDCFSLGGDGWIKQEVRCVTPIDGNDVVVLPLEILVLDGDHRVFVGRRTPAVRDNFHRSTRLEIDASIVNRSCIFV